MDEKEQEIPDDFEVEITDLDAPGSAEPEAPADTEGRRPLYIVSGKPRAPFSPRQRKIHLVITTFIVLVMVGGLLMSTASVRSLVLGAFMGPSPTPTQVLGPGENLFYFDASPSWGQLFIDGHAVGHLPAIGGEAPLRLAGGVHRLVWKAPPFQAESCTLNVPADYAEDTCGHEFAVQVRDGVFASVVSFTETLQGLPGDQQTALIHSVQASFDASQVYETVQTGELYAFSAQHTSAGTNPCALRSHILVCYDVARQPLQATLSLQLDTSTAKGDPCAVSRACFMNNQDCRGFCNIPTPRLGVSASSGWNVIAIAQPLWTFTTKSGAVIVRDQPNTAIQDMNNAQFLWLHITWDSAGWHVFPSSTSTQGPLGNPVCTSAQQDAQDLVAGFVSNGQVIQTDQSTVLDPDIAGGCLVIFRPSTEPGLTPTPVPVNQVAYCLHRFGVLLAANALAHHLWPFLPMADSYEQQLAQQLAQQNEGGF